ncbi:F-box domain-containing protein [Artemisia annua]|uniref:F-box domain-containing protein n=1 Tax=Artemisia annua TaxID=35608 RepID=A0A2U1NHA9_ARTAN|nr:F-box domain-containing protein [Artemisia annua]
MLRDCPFSTQICCERDYMILYNPFTQLQASQKIHIPPLTDSYTYGFGYGTTPDDLKVVRLRDCSEYPGSCEVFSLKTRSWSIPLQPIHRYTYYDDASTTFVNGFLYWKAYKQGYGNLIVAFDVKDMLFSDTQIPSECRSKSCTLGSSSRGCLSLVCSDSAHATCELWVMNKSWSKKYSLPLLQRGNYLYGFNTLCTLDDRKIVMLKKPNRLIIYDMVKGS